jgi:PBSX family phage terminase large subunit
MKYGITPVFYKNYTAFKAKDNEGKRKYKYIINTGGSRSSKTYSLIELIHQICEKNKNIRATAWRDTKKVCKDTIWKDYQKILSISNRLVQTQRNKTESYYYFPETDSYFEFHGTDDEEKVHGLTQQVAWINEPYKISKETFDQIDMRSDVIFIDWNPKKNHWIDDLSKQPNAIVIHSTFNDNPFCPEQSLLKILSYDPNNPLNIERNTASDYLWKVYGLGEKAEKPNRIFKGWQPMQEQAFKDLPYPLFYGLDFGQSAPTALIEMKFDGDNTFYFHERLYKPLNEIQGFLYEQLDRMGINKSIPLVCDSGNELNKTEGIRLKNAGYNVIFAHKGQGSVLSGRELLQKRQVYYTDTSTNLEQEYENHSWRVVSGVQLDEPEPGDDHLIDACLYASVYYAKKYRLM